MPISSAGKTTKPSKKKAAYLKAKQQGFTYISLLAIVAVISVTTGLTTELISTVIAKDKEAELLFRGQAYQRAIKRYYEAQPQKQRHYPQHLSQLVGDTADGKTRYIRELYSDPLTNEPWYLLRNTNGGIMGVASYSTKQPRQQANFPVELMEFEGAESYRDWRFAYLPILTK